jgi:hypothetical protein
MIKLCCSICLEEYEIYDMIVVGTPEGESTFCKKCFHGVNDEDPVIESDEWLELNEIHEDFCNYTNNKIPELKLQRNK